MKNRIYTILVSLFAALAFVGCQTPDEFTSQRGDTKALTSFTAKFVNDESDENEFKAEIDYVNHIINVVFPYNYPRTSNNVLTIDVLTKMRVSAVVENNVVIEPALLYMDLTKENEITIIDNLEKTSTVYTVKAEIRKSAECLITSFTIPAMDVTGVITGTNISLVSVDDIGTQVAAVDISHGATIQPDPRTTALNWDETQTITVVAQNGVDKTEYQVVKSVPDKLPNGIRPGSGVLLWVKKLSEITDIKEPLNVTSLAATGKYVVVYEKGNSKAVVLNGTKGETVGTMDVSMLSTNASITSDDKGNLLLVSRFHESGGKLDMHIYKASGINDQFTLWTTYPGETSGFYRAGRHTSVTGDINGNAIISSFVGNYHPTPSFVYWQVKEGKINETPTLVKTARNYDWPKFGDVIFESASPTSNYIMASHSKDASGGKRGCFYISGADGSILSTGPAETGSNTIMEAGDFMTFNNADYVVYNYVNTFNYNVGKSDAVLLYDFTGRQFGQAINTIQSGTYGARGAGTTQNTDGASDVALHASDNGYYMYLYFMFAGGYVGCVQYDCLDI